jgi:hypothetical protein
VVAEGELAGKVVVRVNAKYFRPAEVRAARPRLPHGQILLDSRGAVLRLDVLDPIEEQMGQGY